MPHGPPAPVEIRREAGRTTVVVHASVHPAVKAAVAAWLAAWAGGELLAVRLAAGASESVLPLFHGFAMAFLAGWTAMGAAAAYALLWCREGTEELSTDGVELAFRRQVRGLGRTRRFAAADVRGPVIRYDRRFASVAEVPPGTLVRLSFDAGWSTYRLNASLRHEDALRAVSALASAGQRTPARPALRARPR